MKNRQKGKKDKRAEKTNRQEDRNDKRTRGPKYIEIHVHK